MKVQITEFFGYIKWLVTDEVFFVDPMYLDELEKAVHVCKKRKNNLSKH